MLYLVCVPPSPSGLPLTPRRFLPPVPPPLISSSPPHPPPFLRWDKVDANHDAFMSITEFHAMLGLKQSDLTKRIFAMLDRNGSQEVDFGEWLASIWIYLSFSRMSLIGLAFQLIDFDGNGIIDISETEQFVKDLSASGLGENRSVNWAELLKGIETAANVSASALTEEEKRRARKKGKDITEDIFARFALKSPAILFAALHIQEVMRERIGGKGFWEKATERRAGKAEVQQVQQFYDTVRLDVKQHMLLDAIVSMKDGWLTGDALAPNGDMERIREVWAKTFGAGKRALMINRGESLKQLDEARGGKKGKKGDSGGGGGGKGGGVRGIVRQASERLSKAVKGGGKKKGAITPE
jgi:Ca2+-binding EF-hand superfamily protein